MVHEIVEIFDHDLLKHVQISDQDMRFLSNIITVEEINA